MFFLGSKSSMVCRNRSESELMRELFSSSFELFEDSEYNEIIPSR
jgi:hypothetical protein